MRENSSEIKFTKEDREKLQRELEQEQEELEKENEEKQEEQEDKENKKDKNKKKTKHKNKTKHKRDKNKRNRKNKDKDNKRRMPLSYILILILLVGIIAAIGIYYYLENEKDVEFSEDYQEAYYTFLEKGIIKKGEDAAGNKLDNASLIYQEKNPKIYMLDVENVDYPIMVSESSGLKTDYQTGANSNAKNIYRIHNITYNNKVNYDTYYNIEDIELLYNIKNSTSEWYLHKEENNIDSYISISTSSTYKFESDEEFDNTFKEIDVDIKKYSISDNISENKLKNTIIKASKSIKLLTDILDDDTLDELEEEEEQQPKEPVENKQEEIKEEKEDEIKEQTNGLKVGNYTISFGTYKNNNITLIIKSNNLCNYKDTDSNIDTNCTYTLEGDSNTGFQLIVNITNDKKYYIISGNNKIGNLEYQK